MYADGLAFLDEERDAWRPFEALLELSDEQLSEQVEAAHGWSGRDVMGHLLAWVGVWTKIAEELAVNPASPAYQRQVDQNREWETLGDAVNARMQEEWSSLPMPELRRRFESMPGELRGYLTVVPESRWLKDSGRLGSLLECTTEHYEEHMPDLRAILASAGR
jgi:hypothetical protein